MLVYKMEWRNAELIEIGRSDSSLKICSKCDNIKHYLKLSYQICNCYKCGLEIDWDPNASINICNIGLIKVGRAFPNSRL